MSEFLPAIEYTLPWEGGLEEDKSGIDPGGITNYGISLRFYQTISPNATAQDIRDLTKDKVIPIYKQNFWDNTRLSQINNQGVANYIFDMGVDHGPSLAVKITQRAINNCLYRARNFSLDLVVDGVLGDKTLTAINTINTPMLIHESMNENAEEYKVIAKDTNQESELNGWLNRAYQRH